MSRKYKFSNLEGLYFVSFATVYWLDVFVRDQYFDKILSSLDFCRKKKGMEVYAYCIMTSHVHLIFRAKNSNPSEVMKTLKVYSSKELQKMINDNPQESRKKYLKWMFERAGKQNSNVKKGQFWQQHNKPIELWSPEVIDQKVNYIHNNPVESGFVQEPEHWKYSSAIDYAGGKGLMDIDYI